MRKRSLILASVVVAALFALPGISSAQYTKSSVSTSVNLSISPVSVVNVTSTSVSLSVNEAQAPDANGNFTGQLDAPVTAGGTLAYETNESSKKITATLGGNLSLLTAPSGIQLTIDALQNGTKKGSVTLSSQSASSGDLVTGLNHSHGSFDLNYSALVGLQVAPGTYNGQVTYTITS